MANIRTYEITFAHLSEYSSPISVYSGSLLQPLNIMVGEWFATGSGTVSLLTSYDNQTYNSIYSTTTSNNSVIYLTVPSFVGSFLKIQRSLSTLTRSGASVNFATVTSDTLSNQLIFSEPQDVNVNDEIWGGGDIFIGVSKQATVQSVTCTLSSPPLDSVTLSLSFISKTPPATGVIVCSFIEPEITSIDITY